MRTSPAFSLVTAIAVLLCLITVPPLALTKDPHTRTGDVETDIRELKAMQDSRLSWVEFFGTLHARRPSNMWYTSIEMGTPRRRYAPVGTLRPPSSTLDDKSGKRDPMVSPVKAGISTGRNTIRLTGYMKAREGRHHLEEDLAEQAEGLRLAFLETELKQRLKNSYVEFEKTPFPDKPSNPDLKLPYVLMKELSQRFKRDISAYLVDDTLPDSSIPEHAVGSLFEKAKGRVSESDQPTYDILRQYCTKLEAMIRLYNGIVRRDFFSDAIIEELSPPDPSSGTAKLVLRLELKRRLDSLGEEERELLRDFAD